MTLSPADHSPQDVYKLMVGSIIPRPIAFVSTVSPTGVRNLAPYSFFTACSANPPVIVFSPMRRGRDGAPLKDTLANIEATREFVVNVVAEEFAQQMNLCAGEYPPEIDEFDVSKLTPLPSDLVKPARVAESPVQMECRLIQIVTVSEKPLGGSLVLGEVLRFHVHDSVLTDGKVDPSKFHAIGRMGGPTYTRITDRFEMERPL